MNMHVVSSQCLSDEQSLLLRLKETLTFDAEESVTLAQWNQNSDCCTWEGIACDEAGHVVGLNLSSELVTGGLENSTLFDLQHLNSLDLSHTNINSAIPSRIGNLTNLMHLNFIYAGFHG